MTQLIVEMSKHIQNKNGEANHKILIHFICKFSHSWDAENSTCGKWSLGHLSNNFENSSPLKKNTLATNKDGVIN